jgi:hypothetical protein
MTRGCPTVVDALFPKSPVGERFVPHAHSPVAHALGYCYQHINRSRQKAECGKMTPKAPAKKSKIGRTSLLWGNPPLVMECKADRSDSALLSLALYAARFSAAIKKA